MRLRLPEAEPNKVRRCAVSVAERSVDLNLDGRSQYNHFFPDLIEA